MSIEITDDQDVPIDSTRLRTALSRSLNNAGFPDAEVSVLLTDNVQIQSLNRTYRKIDKPTDVLSFPASEPGAEFPCGNLLGDIVISVTQAQIQANEHAHSLDDEIVLLGQHGLLHLLGYDHETSEDAWQDAWQEVVLND